MKTVDWVNGRVRLIDQTRLPLEEVFLEYSEYRDVVAAIKTMKVRGAPAIGVAAAYGVALAALAADSDTDLFHDQVNKACNELAASRPTAVNLSWAVERMRAVLAASIDMGTETIKNLLVKEAQSISDEDESMCRSMGDLGSDLINDGDSILTHCNAGALAAVRLGTALSPIKTAHLQGKNIHVYVDETRPLLQGARLTAWELDREHIPMTLITDNMAGYFMSQKKIDKVFVGADRITANGDVANKIGTYSVAVLAHENNIPFYVVAPSSTFDLSLASGDEIIIEERDHDEVMIMGGRRVSPVGVTAANPAFDVTPHRYISAIICEKGILRSPFDETIREAIKAGQ